MTTTDQPNLLDAARAAREAADEQIISAAAERLFEALRTRVPAEDFDRIAKAYALAREAHRDQRRKSGDPYILHPIAVAQIVAEELELGANPVIASLLHDVVEDTPHTVEEIREQFGDDVAFLVDTVTKRKKSHYSHSKQVDNYRQMLDSVHYNIRALLVKLCDRLHNMRTLDSMRPDKQMKIAGETDYFYAPLANRLGLYHVKTELENLSFRYRCPHEFAALEEEFAQYRRESSAGIEEFTARCAAVLEEHGLPARIEVRYRKPYSIWRKMQSKRCDFRHIDQKHYIRIIYPTSTGLSEKDMSLRIYSALTDTFKERPGSVANYIDAPKENGYQSFHVKLLNPEGIWEEMHISSERMVHNSQIGCSAERNEGNITMWLGKFRSLLQDIADNNGELEFMEGVTSSFYNDDIMVFTPKGKGVILPKNATALDFAFDLHSDLGLQAQYARINGKLCSVKTVLRRGDCIEIGTDGRVHAREEWLGHVLTYKAKRCLHAFLRHRPQPPYDRCRHCHPLPGDEVIGFRAAEGSIVLHKRDCPVAIRTASQSGDSIVSVNFESDARMLYPVRLVIRSVDRYHLLEDLIDSITNALQLAIARVSTDTMDEIVTCEIDFAVHSAGELQTVISHIAAIPGVDEVRKEKL